MTNRLDILKGRKSSNIVLRAVLGIQNGHLRVVSQPILKNIFIIIQADITTDGYRE